MWTCGYCGSTKPEIAESLKGRKVIQISCSRSQCCYYVLTGDSLFIFLNNFLFLFLHSQTHI